MTIEWYRVYHGMPEDAKLKVIAKRSKQLMTHVVTVWLCILDAASRHKTRGTVEVDSEQIAVVQDIDQKSVEAIIRALYEKGMIDENHRLTGWKIRQYATDAERAEKYRNSQKLAVAATDSHAASRDITQRHAAKIDVTKSNGTSRKNSKKTPDTDSRVQIADSDNRLADSRPDSEAEAEKKTNSDKKLRARAEKRESEREKQKIGGQAADQKQNASPILLQMLDTWNAEVQSKLTTGQKAILTPKRKEQMTQRWLDDFQQDMRAWKHYCEIIGASEFCLGKIAGKGWTIDLSWAVESSDHVAKILEGGFSGGNHPSHPPACDVPALQEAWDRVLHGFEQKHGKATCRSWLANTTITRVQKHCDGALVTLRCPSKFSCEWITHHYLADLNRLWANATALADVRVTSIELITEG